MRYDFDQLHPRQNTASIKWDFAPDGEPRPVGADPLAADELLPMWLADMDFPTPQPVIETLINRMRHGIIGYTQPTDAYFQAIINWMQRRHHWQIQRDWIVTTPGVMQSINVIIQTFTKPGERVIIQPPVFRPFANSVENNGRVLVYNPLRCQGGRYLMDFDDLAAKAGDPQTRMIILCSPHNPVGRVWSHDELRQLGQICLQHDLLIVSDEIHADLTYSWATFSTFGTVDERFNDRLFLCYSASKTFNLPGLRTSLTIVPNDSLRQQFLVAWRNLNELFGVNTFGTLALQTAFEQGEEWLEQLMAYLEDNYLYLKTYLDLRLPQLQIIRPEALYLVWIDFRVLGLSSETLKQLLYDEAKVWLESGSDFGTEGDGFLRINIACPRAILATALDRIRHTVERLTRRRITD